jgi:acyl-CoA thioesterase II
LEQPAVTAGAPTSATFSAAVALDEREAAHYDVAFAATTQPCPWPKAYGGDLVAAAAAAAMRTVADEGEGAKSLHSMHSYFMRPAEIGAEVRYEVELLKDGRGYSTRHVRGYQGGRPVYVALASFATGEPGGRFAPEAPVVQPPETLPSSADYLAELSGGSMDARTKAYWSGGRSFDMRHVPGPVYLTVEGDRAPHQAVWLRPYDSLREVVGLSRPQRDLAALAYVCDYTILEPVLRVLDRPWARPDLVTASLDHAMWFHGPVRADEWLLYELQAVAGGRARGLSRGSMWTQDGRLAVSVTQEALLRRRR